MKTNKQALQDLRF